MPAIGSDLLQRLRHGPEQQAVALPLVLQCQWRKPLGDGEDDVAIRHREQFLGPLCQPPIPSCGLTLGTMAVAATNGEISITCLMGSIFFWRVKWQSGVLQEAQRRFDSPLRLALQK